MNRRSIIGISATTVLALALLPGHALAQQKSLKEQLVGTWKIVSSHNVRGDGSRVQEQSADVRDKLPTMTLRIEQFSDGGHTTIRLIGRMQAEHVSEVERQIEESGTKVTLDLEEVTLVDVQVVRFLGTCEIRGVSILNCSPYITDWIAKERR